MVPQLTAKTVYGSVLATLLYLILYWTPFCIIVPSTLSGVSHVAFIIDWDTPNASSKKPLVNFNFNLNDLNSRSKNFILLNIEKPDDDMIFALILKYLSDRQISIDKKLINYIIKRIERSYGKIFEFIYKVDEISLKRKKAIDFKMIKEALGE